MIAPEKAAEAEAAAAPEPPKPTPAALAEAEAPTLNAMMTLTKEISVKVISEREKISNDNSYQSHCEDINTRNEKSRRNEKESPFHTSLIIL